MDWRTEYQDKVISAEAAANLVQSGDRVVFTMGREAHGVGLAQGVLDLAIKHVKSREQFGQKIASFQITQFKIAEMATKVELARTLTHKACWLLDRGKADTKTVAMAKWFSARTAVEVVDEGLQLHGGYGYMNDHNVERFYRAAKVLEIYEGTKEIEKMIIGRRILGRY